MVIVYMTIGFAAMGVWVTLGGSWITVPLVASAAVLTTAIIVRE